MYVSYKSYTAKKNFYQGDWVPVPQTDTGGQGEKPKVDRLTLAKELCKIAP